MLEQLEAHEASDADSQLEFSDSLNKQDNNIFTSCTCTRLTLCIKFMRK